MTVQITSSPGSATEGQDYLAVSQLVTFPATSTTQTVPISLLSDDYLEPDEDFTLTLSNPSTNATLGLAYSAVATITDQDQPSVTVNVNDSTTMPPTSTTSGSVGVTVGSGNVSTTVPVGTTSSHGGLCGCDWDGDGEVDLVFNGDNAKKAAIFIVTLPRDINHAAPTAITAQITWDGTTESTVNISPIPGSYVFAVQSSQDITTTGTYAWSIDVAVTYPSFAAVSRTVTGSSDVAITTSTSAAPLAAGWGLKGLVSLVPVTGGVIWSDPGKAGGGLFSVNGAGSYSSPPGDFGTLVHNLDNSYTYTAKEGLNWQFEATGLLTAKVDPHGLATTYTYVSGHLTSISQPDGDVTTFTYDGGHLQTIVQPGGRTTTLAYDSGRLVSLTSPDNSVHTFSYDTAGRLTGEQLGDAVTTLSYDANGFIQSIDRGAGDVLETQPALARDFTADAGTDRVATFTDALGRVTTYTLNEVGQPLEIVHPDGSSEIFTYNSQGQVLTDTDALGRVTSSSYDASGDLPWAARMPPSIHGATAPPRSTTRRGR